MDNRREAWAFFMKEPLRVKLVIISISLTFSFLITWAFSVR